MPQHSVIGVDLGGTKIAVTRYTAETWLIEAEERVPTHAAQRFHHVFEDMVRIIERLRTRNTIAIGIGVPGLVRQEAGAVLRLPNIPDGENIPLHRELRKRFDLPLAIDNDANCFTLAEALQGAGKGQDIVIGITMGTGVGGGIVIHGQLFHGHHGFAGEIGHMLLQPGHPPYRTENRRGDVEQFFSGTAMGKRCEEADDPEQYLEGKVCAFMHRSIFEEVAWLCTNLTHLLDPAIIIFGGSAGHALRPHMTQIRRELVHWLLPGMPLPALAIAELPDAATRGAALLAYTELSL